MLEFDGTVRRVERVGAAERGRTEIYLECHAGAIVLNLCAADVVEKNEDVA
jgi:hypothetical protein